MSMDLTKDELATQEMIKMLEEVDDIDDTQTKASLTEKADTSNIELADIDDDELDTSGLTTNDAPMPSFTSIGEANIQHHHDLDEASIQAVMDELEEKDNIPTMPPTLTVNMNKKPIKSNASTEASETPVNTNDVLKDLEAQTLKALNNRSETDVAPMQNTSLASQLPTLLETSGTQIQQAVTTANEADKVLQLSESQAKQVLSMAIATTEAKQKHIAKTHQMIDKLSATAKKIKTLTDRYGDDLSNDQPLDEARLVQEIDRLNQVNLDMAKASQKLSDRVNQFHL